MKMSKKLLKAVALVGCAVLLVAGSVAGTLAYLTSKTGPVTNTFTFGDINITLTETKGTEISDGRSFKVIPGDTVAKDPVVTVKAGSEACYLFIKVEETNNQIGTEKVVNYTVNTTWTALAGNPGVYYIEITSLTDIDTPYQVLKGGNPDNTTGQVLINSDLTKADLATLATPTLTFTAYAVQRANVADVAEAWNIANS